MRFKTMRRRATVFATTLFAAVNLFSACSERVVMRGTGTPKPSPAAQGSKVDVWFVKQNKEGGDPTLVSVTRTAPATNKLQTAVEQLLEGPNAHEENDGLGTEIPRGTIMIGVKRSNGDVELNLSHRFASGGGSSSFETRLEQLRRTVANLADAPVYLNVEGKRLNVSEGEGIEIRQPINR